MEEQHAVPQDITGFQFKLVGDMTLKQFGELAGGAILAYLFYASGLHPFIKWPLVAFFGFLGVALAFLPIEERPLDVWIANFIKAIYRPTYFVWKKDAGGIAMAMPAPQVVKRNVPPLEVPRLATRVVPEEKKPEPAARIILEEEVQTAQPAVLSIEELQRLREEKLAELTAQKKKLEQKTIEVKEETYKAQNIANIITIDKLSEMRQQKVATLSKEDQKKELIRENAELLRQISAVSEKIATLTGADRDVLQAQLDGLNREKDRLSAAITALGQAGQGATAQAAAPVAPPWAAGATGQARIVDRPIKPQQTIALTNVPNIINGGVFDQRGAPMEGVVLVVKDKTGNSVRALKTNRVGQFVVSTPLPNGSYYLEFEMPNYDFNVYEIVLAGQVIAPLEIRGRYNGQR